jgi:A/G-specific adenine glycosylase
VSYSRQNATVKGAGEALALDAREIASVQRRLRAWFQLNGRKFPWRRGTQSVYRLVVTEVLLQRTHAERVAAFYPFFFKRYSSWRSLAQATDRDLRQFLKPLGLWRRRALSLTQLAQAVSGRGGRLPRQHDEIGALPGVGQYVANSIRLFAHGSPAPLLDAGMARVLERHFGPRVREDIRHDPYLQALAHRVVDSSDSTDLNWALLDVGALICRPVTPECSVCPIRASCQTARARIGMAGRTARNDGGGGGATPRASPGAGRRAGRARPAARRPRPR